MPSTKSFPRISQKPDHWLKRISHFILHLRLWMWAAVHDRDFYQFEIGITRMIRFTPNYCPYCGEFFVLEIGLSRPQLYSFVPMLVVGRFLREHGLNNDDLYQDVPF